MMVVLAHVIVLVALQPEVYFEFMSDPVGWKSQTGIAIALFLVTTFAMYTSPEREATQDESKPQGARRQ
jgi:hypothetical protein